MKDQHFWTPENDEKLRSLANRGKSVSEISGEVERSHSSVRNRARRLSLFSPAVLKAVEMASKWTDW